MAIRITETFRVQAPIDDVWQFVIDPNRVVVCMPGADLEEIVDDRNFLGLISVKIGPVNARFKGKVQFTEVDEAGHTVKMTAEGRETKGGGMAKASMTSALRAIDPGATEVTAEATVQITGRIAQFGQGMVKDISHELFLQFVDCARSQLEGGAAGQATPPAGERPESKPVPVLGLVLKAMWAAIKRFFRRLLRIFRRSSGSDGTAG